MVLYVRTTRAIGMSSFSSLRLRMIAMSTDTGGAFHLPLGLGPHE